MSIAAQLDNRTYVIGRQGDILVDDLTVSSKHAELLILNGRYYLTDLGSTNGTYLLMGGQCMPFSEGYVTADQQVVFGRCKKAVRELLDQAVRLEEQRPGKLGALRTAKIRVV